MIIKIEIKNKIARAVDINSYIVCGNSDYKIEFAFDEEWAEYEEKTAYFIANGKTLPPVVFQGNQCNVPVLSNATALSVGVSAGDLKTTTDAVINCRKSIRCKCGTPVEPTPDVYDQIMQMINDGKVKGDKGDAFTYEDFTEKQLADLKGDPAIVFGDYQTMINAFNTLSKGLYKAGLNVLIVKLNVPDLWISSVEETAVDYTYTSDNDFSDELKANGFIQVGFYKFSALETQKVDLLEYVKFTDIASTSKYGVVKIGQGLKIDQSNKMLYTEHASKNDIKNRNNYYRPINTAYLDYAVKVGITENKETLTDEEKESACEWLGAVRVGINGTVTVGTPIDENDATPKGYVDGEIKKLTSIDTDTLETLEMLSISLEENADIAEALQDAIAEKADKAALQELLNTLYTVYYNKTQTESYVANKIATVEENTNSAIEQVNANIPKKTETWTFTLENGTTVEKEIFVK